MNSPQSAGARRDLLNQSLSAAADHFQSGRWDDAAKQADAALKLAPGNGMALNLLACAMMEMQRFQEAIPLFKRAIAKEPKSPFLRFNLGEAYRRAGAYAAAIPCLQRAAQLKPDFAEALSLAGEALNLTGKEADAERHLRKALALIPTLPSALHGMGLIELQRGRPLAALPLLGGALERIGETDSLRPSLLANLGRAYLEAGDPVSGFSAMADALQLRPQDPNLWSLLSVSLLHTAVVPDGETFRALLTEAFDRPEVNPRALASAALAALMHDGEVAALLEQLEGQPSRVELILESNAQIVLRLITDPLFRKLIISAPVTNAAIELLLLQVRSGLLASVAPHALPDQNELELAVCLARQNFLNEYVHYVGADEQDRVEQLLVQLDSSELGTRPGDGICVALVASFRPLLHTPLADRLAETHWPLLADLLQEQLKEPQREARLRDQIRTLKPAADPTSLAVQAQYEESPYPRWTKSGIAAPVAFAAAIKRALPHMAEATVPQLTAPRVLIAGCGTGLEMMRVANSYAGASILAIDLSATSLAYASRKADEYGIGNVELLQADILDLGLLGDRFDLIESFGVLHHMAEPQRGLAVLAGLLRPQGFLSIGLYSEIGRRAVVVARSHIASRGYDPDLHGIRALRRELIAERRPDLELVLSPASDFWTTSDCRDLLFHVNEHRFTLPQIAEMLRGTGCDFLGVEFGDPADRARFLAGKPLSALCDVAALHQYESDHPEIFGDTYRIWARRA